MFILVFDKDKGKMMLFDIQRARRDTPGCANIVHFDNAGYSLMPQPVLDAATSYLQLEAQIGSYRAYIRSYEAIEHLYSSIAKLIGCSHDEIAILENATLAWDMAFYSIPFRAGDRILIGTTEYINNYMAILQMTRKTGAIVEVIPDDDYGQISVEALRNSLDERVKLIAITHTANTGGLVNPIEEVGKVAREAGILYIVDACQSVGQMPIDVNTIGCDMLATPGRKYLRAPRGTSFLYVRREVLEHLEPPFLDTEAATLVTRNCYEVRSDARRFENWEANIAARIGFAVAVDYTLQWEVEKIWQRVKQLSSQLRTQLRQLPGVTIQDRGIIQNGLVTFTLEGQEPEEIKRQLAEQNINVSAVGLHNTSRLDLESRGLLSGMVRASVHYYNTEEEIEYFCAKIAEILAKR
jgi:cysteine desulfurase/selenocysteine lyase